MIQSQGLQYQYTQGPTLAFADVDLPQGGTLLVRGRSGSGKSTWLGLVAGLRSATAGRIAVAGQVLADLPGARRDAWRAQAIGFVPQRLHLSPALTVADNLGLVFFAAGMARDDAAIARALQALGVQALAARKPQQLSGGQAQRVALARAVLLQPQLLLADEPTASLDDEAAADALALLRQCAAHASASLVIATHDSRVVQALHDAAQVLDLNKNAAQGMPGARDLL